MIQTSAAAISATYTFSMSEMTWGTVNGTVKKGPISVAGTVEQPRYAPGIFMHVGPLTPE